MSESIEFLKDPIITLELVTMLLTAIYMGSLLVLQFAKAISGIEPNSSHMRTLREVSPAIVLVSKPRRILRASNRNKFRREQFGQLYRVGNSIPREIVSHTML